MKINTPCSTKGCPFFHTTTAPGPGSYTAEPEPCFACAEKKAREDAADEFVRKSPRG